MRRKAPVINSCDCSYLALFGYSSFVIRIVFLIDWLASNANPAKGRKTQEATQDPLRAKQPLIHAVPRADLTLEKGTLKRNGGIPI
ncbi:hypothetical protein GE061_003377 [Apolygus lucorum]|uniref:Uncharacterized protein n=1 Tax=Apolygus lucorum TaxID=248454 RepID=A0A8S9X3D5_APOLU|nr:hypothetical protein GE061_003377 [Apolygus lucorum]